VPKVSVITAAYNHVEFVRQSVESALNQTYRDFEHIIVDDGSTDGTAEVLQSFENRIKYIRQENRGAHAAINAGIRASSGDYIAILDSDDAWLPHKLERQMPMFDQRPDAGMVYSQAYVINSEGHIENPEIVLGAAVDEERPFEDVLMNYPVPVLTAVIRRDCFEDIGFFDERWTALSDWEFWLRLVLKWPIVFVPEPLALYRVHGKNTFASLISTGHTDRERLAIINEASAWLRPKDLDLKKRIGNINARFAHTLVRDIYGLTYRRRFSRALMHLLFALRLRPMFLKDLPSALRLEPKLSQRGNLRHLVTKMIQGDHEAE
jgi:glycosyltransferase involved in cell wall biosynthesis